MQKNLIGILFFCLLFFINGCALEKSKKPPVAPAIEEPTTTADSGSVVNFGIDENNQTTNTNGFKLLKIPIIDNYQLGMMQDAYNSLVDTKSISINTTKRNYAFVPKATFVNKRLCVLHLTHPDIVVVEDMDDLILYFQNKLGAIDGVPVVIEDAATDKKTTTLNWSLKYYTLKLVQTIVYLKDGSAKMNYTLTYSGNVAFTELLNSIEATEAAN
ncbi:MAG: hypothetical protein ACOYKE_04540 [Ferruginibacter sp.]